MTTRELLHRQIDELPEEALGEVEDYLADLLTPDAPLSAEEEAMIADSHAAIARGDVLTHDQLRAELRQYGV